MKSYTFENVKRAHTIEVSFTRANEFVDVPLDSYFYEAVMWAVENGVTTGISASRFDPDGICTRAQAVTFLWRAAGSPKPETRTMAFHRRSRGQLLLRCCAVGGQGGRHQGYHCHHVQP